MGQLRVRQDRSSIGCQANQRNTLRSLGLKRIGHQVTRKADAVTVGMVNTVPHLVSVEEVNNG